MSERYLRQEAFFGIGEEGQQKLLHSRVMVAGLGALGSMCADRLARAGVGFLRLVDRDHVETGNLQRQALYTEEDALNHAAKADAAFRHLKAINTETEIESVTVDINSDTIDVLLEDIDLVIDATDNMETRFLINEACHEKKIPWIYGAVAGSSGMTMNILPDSDSPCLNCLMQDVSRGITCRTVGVLNTTTAVMASLQCTEAFKILTGNCRPREGLYIFDLWEDQSDLVRVVKKKDCPVCSAGQYTYYKKKSTG